MNPHRLGVIADTHGLLRLGAVQALWGADQILHAGDIGKPEILDELRKIAPVVAIRGNVDHGLWAQGLPRTRTVTVGALRIHVIHDLNDLQIDPAAAGFAAVISGHSHQPSIRHQNGVLFLNPGSAGPRRFNLPVSVAQLRLAGAKLVAELVELQI